MRKDRPGFTQRARADGTFARYWKPQRAVAGTPDSLPTKPIPHDADDDEAARLCQLWTEQLRADLDNRAHAGKFDGTVAGLIRVYRTAESSPYQALKHSTRTRDYDPSLQLIEETVGARAIHMLAGADFRRWYEKWSEKGVRRGHGAIRKLRAVLSYGVEERLPGCSHAREILSLIRFAAPAPRRERMTYEQAKAICDEALRRNFPSIAQTQAMQWDMMLRRIHVIGEWVPITDGEEGGIIAGRTRWRGPTAADIVDGVFTPPNVETGKVATPHDLSLCPLVKHVTDKAPLPEIGPLIVSEITGRPWRANYYALEFRSIARAVGVPDSVWSMDARSGAITEAEAVTDLEAARKAAGHSSTRTTQNYVRGEALDATRKVAEARARLRQ